MSYILNALRKSERERQTLEPETIAERIVIHHSPRERHSTGLLVALVLINVAILVYFLGFSGKAPSDESETIAVAKPIAPKSAEATVQTVDEVEESSVQEIPGNKIDKIAVALAPVIKAPTTPVANKNPPPLKPSLPDKTVEAKASLQIDSNESKPKAPVESRLPTSDSHAEPVVAMKPAALLIEAEPTVVETVEAIREEKALLPVKDDLPFLEDMPIEIQRSLPDLTINVFSYAELPSERFVMIDMVKYVPGQRIKDTLDFQEIRSDAIVVTYKGRKFKIPRP